MIKNKKNLIYKALAITFSIMFFSLLFSQIIFDNKINKIDKNMAQMYSDLNEEKLFLSFSNEFSHDSNLCETIETYLGGLSEKIFQSGTRLQKMYKNEQNIDQIKDIQKEWVFLNLELWIRLIKYNKVCEKKRNYILYFYPYNCNRCAPYSLALTKLNQKFKEKLWLFSLPAEIDIKMIKMLMKHFKIKEGPSVIYNGKLLEGENIIEQINEINPLQK